MDLTFAAFDAWYGHARGQFLEPARLAAVRMLEELLDLKVDPLDRGRFRISSSRVKSVQRSFAKISGQKYRSKFSTYDSVPDIIDDLVGLRLICHNLSDIAVFQEAIADLPLDDGSNVSLSVEEKSQRDYFASPKASGYRAFHVNFVVPVSSVQGSRRIRVEVQVRTLLQDGWGELTHEDTYKPGSKVPEWIVRMSLRMADLLAAVDNIAQDIRADLDTEARRSANAETTEPHKVPRASFEREGSSRSRRSVSNSETHDGETSDSQTHHVDDELRSALVGDLREIIGGLSRPAELTTLTQSLSAAFGTDISSFWADSGGFRAFLKREIPEAVITGPAPGYVHPTGADPGGWPQEGQSEAELPNIIWKLRAYERKLPAISALRIQQAIGSVAAVLQAGEYQPTESGRISASQLAALARETRDHADAEGDTVLRPHAQFILQILNREGLINRTTTTEQIEGAVAAAIISKAIDLNLVDDFESVRTSLEEWLQGHSQ